MGWALSEDYPDLWPVSLNSGIFKVKKGVVIGSSQTSPVDSDFNRRIVLCQLCWSAVCHTNFIFLFSIPETDVPVYSRDLLSTTGQAPLLFLGATKLFINAPFLHKIICFLVSVRVPKRTFGCYKLRVGRVSIPSSPHYQM